MKNIFSSATRIVLILFALTACAGFLLGKLSSELFAAALMSVLSYYYGNKQSQQPAAQADLSKLG